MKKLLFLLVFIPLVSFGQLKTEIEGSIIKTYSSSGNLISECSYPKRSYCKQFYKSGLLKKELFFYEGNETKEIYYSEDSGRIITIHTEKNGKYNGQYFSFCPYDSDYIVQFERNYKDHKQNGIAKMNACETNLKLNRYKYSPIMVALYRNDELIKEINSYFFESYDPKIISEPDLHYMTYDENLNITGNIKKISNYDLRRMVNFYLDNCKNYGIIIPKQNIKATFEELEGNTIALAMGKNYDDDIVIKVDPENWQNSSPVKRWYILYHELGHDVLNLSHGEGGKMMFNFVERDYSWDEFISDRNEMFYNYVMFYNN